MYPLRLHINRTDQVGTAWAQLAHSLGAGADSPEIKIWTSSKSEESEGSEGFMQKIWKHQSHQAKTNKVKDLWQSKLHKRKHVQQQVRQATAIPTCSIIPNV